MSGAENSVQKQHEESTAVYEGIGRYAAYAARLRTLITTGSRYIAYSSDIGEAFRPLTKPIVVSAAYGISWAYIISDVGYTVWHASNHMDPNDSSYKKDLAWIGARRTVFQTLASMFLPALTIHSVVRYSAPLFSKFSNMRARSIGPTVLGLCTVPLLPVLFDHPVEYAVENAFDLVELKAAALQGDAAAQQSFDKKFAEMKNSMLGSKPKVQEPKRIVDTIPSDTPLDGSTVQKLAILGIGIDMVSMPRMRQLLVRQAKRLASSPLYRPLAVAPRYADTASPAESQEPKLLAAAAQHFARRTLSNAESDFWATFAAQAGHEDHLRFLATRWACKEAAYKAVHPYLQLTAKSISVERPTTSGHAKPRLVLDRALPYKSADGACGDELARTLELHLSVSHDGDYVVANVVAEHGTS